MTKHITKNMETDFLRSVYRDCVAVPDFLLANYGHLGLTAAEAIDLARLFGCREAGGENLSPSMMSARFAGREAELSAFLAAMQDKGLLYKDEISGLYSLEGVYEHLLELWAFLACVPKETGCQVAQTRPEECLCTDSIKAVYALFEAEFARSLSPIELQKLNAWLITDGWSAVMIEQAVQRAVMHGALSLAYIDKILLRWRSEGITRPEQLAADEFEQPKKRRDNKSRAKKSTNEPSYAGEADYSKFF